MNLVDIQRAILTKASEMIDKRLSAGAYRPRWASIIATSPVLIEYDADGPSTIPPFVPAHIGPLAVGDRVQVGWYKGQTTILGRAGGGTFSGSAIFASLESGVSVQSGSAVLVEGRKAVMTLSLLGVSRTSGNQRVEVGVLREELWPVHAFGFGGYFSNGAVQLGVTSAGAVSVRWASSASSNQMYVSAAWVLAGG